VRNCKRLVDSYQFSNNTIILFATQYKNDNTAFIDFLHCLAILRAFCQWKIEQKVRKCFVKCFILRIGTWLDAREIHAICMRVVTSSSVASPNFLGANTSTLSEQQYFVRDTAFQSTKWQDML